MQLRCKRIIDGKTYNTETATRIAEIYLDEGPYDSRRLLYQNRFGAYFEYTFREDSDGPPEVIEPLTPEAAQTWLERYCPDRIDLIESLFGAMPEADTTEIKYTLRMPESLKERLAIRAKANGQSLNAWIVRCLESCAAGSA